MRQSLSERLRKLELEEARKADATRDPEADEELALTKLRFFLEWRGVEPRPDESMAMTYARALEIDYNELNRQIQEGIDPIHKYLVDHSQSRTGVTSQADVQKFRRRSRPCLRASEATITRASNARRVPIMDAFFVCPSRPSNVDSGQTQPLSQQSLAFAKQLDRIYREIHIFRAKNGR